MRTEGLAGTLIRGAVAALIYLFGAFILYLANMEGSRLDMTAAVALVGPLVTAVTVYFFHAEATAAGASIGATSAAAGAGAVSRSGAL